MSDDIARFARHHEETVSRIEGAVSRLEIVSARHEERFPFLQQALEQMAKAIQQTREDMVLAFKQQAESQEKNRVKFLPMAGTTLAAVVAVAGLMWFIAEKAVVDPMAARVANIEVTLARPDFRTLGAAALEREVNQRLHALEAEIRKNNDRLIKLEARP